MKTLFVALSLVSLTACFEMPKLPESRNYPSADCRAPEFKMKLPGKFKVIDKSSGFRGCIGYVYQAPFEIPNHRLHKNECVVIFGRVDNPKCDQGLGPEFFELKQLKRIGDVSQ